MLETLLIIILIPVAGMALFAILAWVGLPLLLGLVKVVEWFFTVDKEDRKRKEAAKKQQLENPSPYNPNISAWWGVLAFAVFIGMIVIGIASSSNN